MELRHSRPFYIRAEYLYTRFSMGVLEPRTMDTEGQGCLLDNFSYWVSRPQEIPAKAAVCTS